MSFWVAHTCATTMLTHGSFDAASSVRQLKYGRSMNELPSAEFRKQYAKLTEPTVVTVNGHPIGTWIPRHHMFDHVPGPTMQFVERDLRPGATHKHRFPAQAQRDDLLRKINRGK
jgi:hypothetical protein